MEQVMRFCESAPEVEELGRQLLLRQNSISTKEEENNFAKRCMRVRTDVELEMRLGRMVEQNKFISGVTFVRGDYGVAAYEKKLAHIESKMASMENVVAIQDWFYSLELVEKRTWPYDANLPAAEIRPSKLRVVTRQADKKVWRINANFVANTNFVPVCEYLQVDAKQVLHLLLSGGNLSLSEYISCATNDKRGINEANEKCIIASPAHFNCQLTGSRNVFLATNVRLQLAEERVGRAEFIPSRLAKSLKHAVVETGGNRSVAPPSSPRPTTRKKKTSAKNVSATPATPKETLHSITPKYMLAQYASGARGKDLREQRLKIRKSWIIGTKIALDPEGVVQVSRPTWQIDVTLSWHDHGEPYSSGRKMTCYANDVLLNYPEASHLKLALEKACAAFSVPDLHIFSNKNNTNTIGANHCRPQIEVEIECIDPCFCISQANEDGNLTSVLQPMWNLVACLNDSAQQ